MAVSFDQDALVDTDGASKLLNIPAATLVKWRSTGENNIPYVKIGRSCRYRPTDLRDWIERHIKHPIARQ